MSPLRRHTPRSRDDALERRHRMTVTAAVGGLAAVGVITGALAVNAAQSSASTPGGVSSDDGGVSQGSGQQNGVSQDPSAAQGGTLNPPVNAPSSGGGGGGVQAITGGSGHR